MEADDGRLTALAKALGYADAAELKDVVARLLADADIAVYLRRYVSDPQDIFRLVPEMITPNRSGNNMRSVDFSDIALIMRRSLEMYIAD